MKKIFDLNKDRSAISAVLVIIVVAIVVVAAVAAYVVLSGEDEEKILAPGSKLEYDYEIEGEDVNGIMNMEIVGQSNVNYFARLVVTVSTVGSEETQYLLFSKEDAAPEDAVKTGTEVIDTIDGKKTLDVWEKIEGDSKMILYTDSEVIYLIKQEIDLGTEVMVFSFTLKSKELIYQKISSYKQSDDIGRKATYEYTAAGGTLRLVNECVADCEDNKFAVSQTTYFNGSQISTESPCYMSESPYGVIIGSVDTGTTALVNTIDGQKTLEIWEFDQRSSTGTMIYYFVDSDTGLVYAISQVSSLVTIGLALTSYD
jgi:hypothetical protein